MGRIEVKIIFVSWKYFVLLFKHNLSMLEIKPHNALLWICENEKVTFSPLPYPSPFCSIFHSKGIMLGYSWFNGIVICELQWSNCITMDKWEFQLCVFHEQKLFKIVNQDVTTNVCEHGMLYCYLSLKIFLKQFYLK